MITTRDGKNEQMWVLIMQPLSREEPPVCGALLESSGDKGEVPCLRKVSDKIVGIDASHRHDLLLIQMRVAGIVGGV